jgi:hypothetical protein
VLAVVLKALESRSERKNKQEQLGRRPVSYTQVGNEWEAETADGRRFRSNDYGIIWYSFPDGYKTDVDHEYELEDGLERHKRLEKWTSQ